jgi:hypothetical protein
MMDQQNKEHLQNICAGIVDAFAGTLAWKWDGRFEASQAEFSSADGEAIRQTLAGILVDVWDSTTIAGASDFVKTQANNFGGLRPGQLFFSSDPGADALILGAWWPWGNGTTISLRLVPVAKNVSDEEMAGPIADFRGWFSL